MVIRQHEYWQDPESPRCDRSIVRPPDRRCGSTCTRGRITYANITTHWPIWPPTSSWTPSAPANQSDRPPGLTAKDTHTGSTDVTLTPEHDRRFKLERAVCGTANEGQAARRLAAPERWKPLYLYYRRRRVGLWPSMDIRVNSWLILNIPHPKKKAAAARHDTRRHSAAARYWQSLADVSVSMNPAFALHKFESVGIYASAPPVTTSTRDNRCS